MKQNIYFKHAALTKLSLIASLLFVALAVTLLGFTEDSFVQNPPCLHGFTAVGTDHTLSGEQNRGLSPDGYEEVYSRKAATASQSHPAQNLPLLSSKGSRTPLVEIPGQRRSATIPKISPAELWVRLIEEEKFSVEPQILEGNRFR